MDGDPSGYKHHRDSVKINSVFQPGVGITSQLGSQEPLVEEDAMKLQDKWNLGISLAALFLSIGTTAYERIR
jgi:hypothetical protein